MSYKRSCNKHDLWLHYCQEHQAEISALNLHKEIFRTEQNFRKFATNGFTIDGKENVQRIGDLNDAEFWVLHNLITRYFEMDALLFADCEKSRIGR